MKFLSWYECTGVLHIETFSVCSALGSIIVYFIINCRNGSKDILKLIRITLGDIIGSQFSISKPRISLEGQHSTKNVITSDTVSLLPGMTFYFTLSFNPRYAKTLFSPKWSWGVLLKICHKAFGTINLRAMHWKMQLLYNILSEDILCF